MHHVAASGGLRKSVRLSKAAVRHRNVSNNFSVRSTLIGGALHVYCSLHGLHEPALADSCGAAVLQGEWLPFLEEFVKLPPHREVLSSSAPWTFGLN